MYIGFFIPLTSQNSKFVFQPLLNVPEHVGIIMDGNGRWAEQRGKNRNYGHRIGAESVRAVVRSSAKFGVKKLSLFAFSQENWHRSKIEVAIIMDLLSKYLSSEKEELHANNVQLRVVGDLSKLSKRLQSKIESTVEYLESNTGLKLSVAISYGGRDELVDATKKIISQLEQGNLSIDQIDSSTISRNLYSPEMGDLDLIIRTSGEKRISNFMLWQAAYAELYFTDTFWPDFRDLEYYEALVEFSKRKRRFGRATELGRPINNSQLEADTRC